MSVDRPATFRFLTVLLLQDLEAQLAVDALVQRHRQRLGYAPDDPFAPRFESPTTGLRTYRRPAGWAPCTREAAELRAARSAAEVTNQRLCRALEQLGMYSRARLESWPPDDCAKMADRTPDMSSATTPDLDPAGSRA